MACVIPARDAEQRIAATVAAATGLPGVQIVIVCDDGSTDHTGRNAGAAGAVVVTHARSRGQAAAIESGVNALGVLEQRDRRPECGTLLLLDADLGQSASGCSALLRPVTAGEADLTIAVPPGVDRSDRADGRTGLVWSTAARGIVELVGFSPRAPLSTTRCLTRRAFELASPLAAGWGAEVGMIVDVIRAGLTVREIEVALEEGRGGGDLAAPLQRARQLGDVTRALAARGLVQAGIQDFKDSGGVQGLINRFKR